VHGGANSLAISTGVLDVGLVEDQVSLFGYLRYPLVRNQLVSLRRETRRMGAST
jgi:hypothetical protein